MDLESIITTLRKERPPRLRMARSDLRFPKGPLTAEELAACTRVETPQGLIVSEYQWRALAVLDDDFYRYRWKRHRDESMSIFSIDEFKPMFNEIHRAVVYLVGQGKTPHDALVEFLKPNARESRKDADESGTDHRTTP
jgi:hypothetical protein